jgi:hypothetical protein
MQLVNEELDPLLHFSADGIFPEILQVRDNAPTIADDTAAHRVKHLLIGVIDQVKKGLYFFVFLHVDDSSLKYGINIGEVYKTLIKFLSTSTL